MMKLTPAMQQFMEVKRQYPDGIILFRMGDFYETFFDDAILASKLLQITLTKRGKGDAQADLAGFPFHALDRFIGKLVHAGHKVVICEQLEDPKQAKGVVKRGVTRVITPGTVIEDHILQEKANNFIVSLFPDQEGYALAYCDISTGHFSTMYCKDKIECKQEVDRIMPKEMVLPSGMTIAWLDQYIITQHIYAARVELKNFFPEQTRALLEQHKIAHTHIKEEHLSACGGLFSYLLENQKGNMDGITQITVAHQEEFMKLDESTIRNLEILYNIRDRSTDATLLSVLDHTNTAMGAKLLRQWLVRPLISKKKIDLRLSSVQEFIQNTIMLEDSKEVLGNIKDIERLSTKISYQTANARDLLSLGQSIQQIELLQQKIEACTTELLKQTLDLPNITNIVQEIFTTIKDDPPHSVRDGNMIRFGISDELDELHSISKNARKFIADFEKSEIERTGITSLKIKFNRTFGYFIEVSNRFKDKTPEHYIRKQTLTTGERYITEELKTYEDKILGAQEKIQQLEFDIFSKLIEKMKTYTADLQSIATQIAKVDVLCSFAVAAKKNRYICPEITEQYDIKLHGSRHPVIEKIEQQFVANDCELDHSQRCIIITGPNMAGKSTYMRQVALCSLMAQIGSFVPATHAKIAIVDKIFTRVGAHDDLTKGQSTFMVEMSETAYILNNATEKSLIIIDEIGRGTSTYDGTAIAWAVAEDIITRIKAKTLFATHYHTLTKLNEHEGVSNANVAVDDQDGDITFLHSIQKGGTDKSYGIHVAKIAGLPPTVLENAQKVQFELEQQDNMVEKVTTKKIPVKQKDLGDW